MSSQRIDRGNVASSVVLAAVGALIVYQATHWEYLDPSGPGPGFFPIWYGVLLTALSLLLLGISVVRPEAPAPRGGQARGLGRALMVWAAFTLFVALLESLGFVIGFGLFTFFVVFALYRRPFVASLATAAGLSAGFYLFFSLALKVTLPAGPLPF
jgi:putative tricarboxylic transport membrane protein